MNAKNVILTLAIAALFLIAAVGSASAKECGIGIADCDCGDTVVANWALTGNMFCPAGHGLIVGADNIVIDGAGYTIDGIDPGACGSRAGIYSDGYDDVTIRNLKVRKFCNGIFIENYAYRNTIHNCEVYDNGIDTVDAGTMGMRLIRVDDSTISNNSAHDTKGKGDGCESGGNGIYIFAGHRNLVTNNSLYDNRKSGYFTKMQPRDTNVTHNNIWGNGGCGINLMCMMSNYHIIEHNNVWENGCGIQTNGEPNTIRYNNVTNNAGRGIIMAGGTVNSNIVCGNGGTDISAQSAGSVTGDDNTCDTTSNYHDDGEDRCTWLCPDVPDMVITKKSEEWVVEGLTYNITYTIKNFGKVTANASKTGIYIDDELNTTDDVPELVVGASINHEVGPFTISEDSDTIEVCADCEDNVSESWENNNCKKNVFVSEPDLVIVEKTEEWVVEGSTYNITYTVKNIGTYKASASKTGIYIDDVLNTTDDVPELDPDASYSNTLGPFTLSEYVDTIKICADCEYNVSESFETNNCMTNVFGVADLIIAGKTEEWIAEGSTYNITYEVKNIGFARASASKTGICIDDIFNRTDDVPELDPDASYSNTLGPFTMSGYNDEIKVCADYEGNVLEINEDNNCTTNVFGVPIYVNTSGWWRVGGPFNPSSSPIQAAVNNAVAEDTIVVKDGTYTENVNVNTAHLTIQSENGSANCVVQASNHDDHVFYLGSSAVNIVGFRITGANNAYGIYSPASYCNIRDNNLLSNNAGVCIKGSYGSCVNNTVSNNYYGIRTILSWGGTQNAPKFINNTVTDNYYGFSIGGTGMTYDAELIDNTALNNTYGIYLCGHYTMRTKLMSNTALNNTYGIYLGGDYTTDTELISNTASNNTYGIYLGGSETYYTKLTNNIACENENTDIYVGDYATVSVSVDNTCSTTHNFNDEGEEGCTWKCLPDLTIVEKMEQWVVEGSTYNVAYTVENIGTSRANASKTCIYIDGILNATDDVPELEAGDNHTATLGPFSLSEGNDTIKVCADCEDNVTECDEENNCLENVFGLGCLAEDGTIFFCGDTVTKSCTFQGDMSCSFTDGLKIGADNITINGNDFILDGAGCMHDFPHSGILNEGYDDVTIESLEVKGFCHGMYLYGTGAEGDVYRNTIEHCDIHHNGNASTTAGLFGITMKYVYNSTIRNNTVHHQIAGVDPNPGCEDGGNGMFLYKGCYNNFTENKVYNNTKGGIFIKMQPMHNNISHNDLWDNGQGGIILRCMMSNYNLIEHNNASNNYGSGMFIGARNNTIRYNKICDNKDGGPYSADSVGGHGYGIKMGRSDGSFNNYLHDNEICGNDYKDIYIVSGVTGNHGINNTCDTTYNYGDDGTTGCTLFCGGTTIIAGFTAEPTKGAVPLTVNFTDKSKAKEGIESWSWNFDDGATSEAQNATHTYETTDAYSYYNVSLTVNESGSGGLSNDTDTKPEYIKVWKPKAAPNADFVCSKGVGATTEPVEFTDKSIGEVNAGSWLWDFGDGNTSTEQNPVYCYSKEGIYTVSLTVTGPGGTSKDTKSNCTRVGPGSGEQWPLIDAHFFASTRTGYAPFTVQFTDMSRSEGNITSWLWDFGDENMSDGRNPTHTYASPGTYNVSIETTSTTGAKTRETKTEYISVLSREYIPTTPFVINGRTFNAEGCGLNNCTVTIENLNTNANWTAKTSATSNYYQLVLDSDDVSAGDTLRFNAMKEAYSNTTYCTVTQEDINLGGVFSFNLTLAQGDITPPASVTDLTNVTYEQTYINWTWTDPAGADFSHVIVYVDGGFKQNVPKGVQHYNATGFEPDTEHTIATRTEDRSGNINLTWVNRTARTSSPPVEVVDDLTTEDIFVKGTVTNDHTYTHTSNDKYESIEEIRQGPRSLLEHKWTIEVPTGTKSSVTFHLEAHQIDTGENDHFIFAYSTDGSIYKDMVKVNTTTDTNLTYELTNELSNDFSGAVYIRVRDTDRNRGKKVLDTISIDHMFIRSVLAPLSYGVTVTIDEASQTVKPGESTTYHVRAKNTGDFDASYSVVMSGTAVDEATIDVSPPNWNTGTLGPNTENVQTVTVSTTSGTLDGTYTMIATATCEQDESVTDSATSKLVVSSVTNTMHIDSIDMSLSQRKAGKNIFTHATALITIVDATGAPADGATVGGHWSDVTTDTDSGLTNSTGQVSLNSEEVKNAPSGTTFTFTVDDVSLTGGTYDPESNVETSDSITV